MFESIGVRNQEPFHADVRELKVPDRLLFATTASERGSIASRKGRATIVPMPHSTVHLEIGMPFIIASPLSPCAFEKVRF